MNKAGKFGSPFSISPDGTDTIGNRFDFDPKKWCEFFIPSASSLWEEAQCGSIYFDIDGERYSLSFTYKSNIGISIFYNRWNPKNISRRFSFVSQANNHTPLKSEFEFFDNGDVVPLGSFLSWSSALAVVEEFLKSPEILPTSITWVDSKTLEWPPEDSF